MRDDNPYSLQGLDEYLRQAAPSVKERGEVWRAAIGLQEVDGLQPSPYLIQTAQRHIVGEISFEEAQRCIDGYYSTASKRSEQENDRTEEADKVSTRITGLLSEKTFNFSPTQLITIHRRLFEGIYSHAGRIRDYNITKREWVLNGETIFYAGYDTIREALEYDMQKELDFNYSQVPVDNAIRHLMRFCADLWQIHAFGEGNTRTTAVFMIKYLRTLGFKVMNDVFARYSWYFRNALVRANYNNLQKGITETTVYLERFFRNMLLGERHPLRNRELHVDWEKVNAQSANNDGVQSAKNDVQSANSTQSASATGTQSAKNTVQSAKNTVQSASAADTQSAKGNVQSAKAVSAFSLKCKYCTLEEVALLKVIELNPAATQKEMAMEIGKSERTVKSITVKLQEAGILKRVGGKRNGRWELAL